MRAITLLKPGFLTTVQDLGRWGHAAIGVAPSGALDSLSARIGNRLAGNPDRAAVLEMTLLGAELRFEAAMHAVLAGANARAILIAERGTERQVDPWQPFAAEAGTVLRIGQVTAGARIYLCIQGGIATAPVLGSRATHIASGIGGFEGRPLRAGDRVPIGASSSQAPTPHMSPNLVNWVRAQIQRRTVRVTPSSHTSRFSAAALQALYSATWTVTESSDRMGLRLSGPAIEPVQGGRMITEPTPTGAIQITEGGQPILLLNDGPTTGGYPVIAAVASVDLPTCGQLRPRDVIRFEPISHAHALDLYRGFDSSLNEMIPPHP